MLIPDRQQVFEFMAFWLGGTTAAEVAEVVGVRRECAQNGVVGAYKSDYPGVLKVCPKTKRTMFTHDAGALKLSPTTMSEILAVTGGMQAWSTASGRSPKLNVPYEDTARYYDNEPALEHFRTLYEALARRRSVVLDYQSKSSHFSTTFSPHTLVRTSYRTHVRGWSQKEDSRPGRYLDLIPARITRIESVTGESYVDSTGDDEWHRRVLVEARLLSNLPDSVMAAVAREHIHGDSPSFRFPNVRAASARYVIEGILNRRVSRYDGPLWSVTIDGQPYERD